MMSLKEKSNFGENMKEKCEHLVENLTIMMNFKAIR